jgi:hypothetical protein
MATASVDGDGSKVRQQIAIWVLIVSGVGLLLVSAVAIWLAPDRADTTKLVFASIVPLIGTWVGAVLAYYFSRENLQAGSDSALNAVRVGTGSVASETMVTAVMIPRAKISPVLEVANDDEARARTLRDIYSLMTSSQQGRVPVFTNAGTALYVVHEADIEKYSQSQATAASDLPAAATLGTLADLSDINRELTSFVSVSPADSLVDARSILSRVPHAKDVFVTTDGQKTGTVLGWITNSDLARAS